MAVWGMKRCEWFKTQGCNFSQNRGATFCFDCITVTVQLGETPASELAVYSAVVCKGVNLANVTVRQ